MRKRKEGGWGRKRGRDPVEAAGERLAVFGLPAWPANLCTAARSETRGCKRTHGWSLCWEGGDARGQQSRVFESGRSLPPPPPRWTRLLNLLRDPRQP